MTDYVLYHTHDVMDIHLRDAKDFRAATSRDTDVTGQRVWLIVGKGSPREYFLVGYFTPERRSKAPQGQGDFEWILEAPVSAGVQLKRHQWVPLKGLKWFHGFLTSQRNFDAGLNPITDPTQVANLEAALATVP